MLQCEIRWNDNSLTVPHNKFPNCIFQYSESRPNVTLSNQKPNVSLYDELGTSWKTWEHFEVVGESWRWLAVSGDHNVMTLEVVKHTTNSQATHPLGDACTTHKMIWNTCDNYQSWNRMSWKWVGSELEMTWKLFEVTNNDQERWMVLTKTPPSYPQRHDHAKLQKTTFRISLELRLI